MFREKSSNGLYGGKDNEKSRGLQSRGIKNTKNQEEARKKQPGAVCGRRGCGAGNILSPSARQEESSGREAGPTIWKLVSLGAVSLEAAPPAPGASAGCPGAGMPPGNRGSAPFAAPWRSQFLFHIIKRNYESHGKALKPFPASLSFAASPRLGRGGIVCGWAWSRRRRPAWISSTLRTWFHSTYIKHKPESANDEACRMRPPFAAALRKRCFPNLEQSYEKQST